MSMMPTNYNVYIAFNDWWFCSTDFSVIDLLKRVGIIDKVTIITNDFDVVDLAYVNGTTNVGFIHCKNDQRLKYLKEACADDFSKVIYFGDDVYDVPIFEKVKYNGTYTDSISFVKDAATYVSNCGKDGCVVGDLLCKITDDILYDTEISFLDIVHGSIDS